MIKKVIIKNFKSISSETYEFNQFDLLVGRNNSGKSTILQALAIWQYCIDEFGRNSRKESAKRGVSIVLPNFTALPVPEFNLLWHEKTDRIYTTKKENPSKKNQEYILIEVDVHWETGGKSDNFKVQLRYQSPQAIFAIPESGWRKLSELKDAGELPVVAFVPPFSGLEPTEEKRTEAPIRKQIGKGQPGSVLRNLLLKVYEEKEKNDGADWKEIQEVVKNWFSFELMPPEYDDLSSTHIVCRYRDKTKKEYDIMSAGSGFHQTLTLLAFLYGYRPTTILLDEPDAHLHVNLQEEITKYFKKQSLARGIQFVVATHAEQMIKTVDVANIISILGQKPKRIDNVEKVITAMSVVTNQEATQILDTEAVLYIEGEQDELLLGAWEKVLSLSIIKNIYVKVLGGGSKEDMLKRSDIHFNAVRSIIPKAKRIVLLDNDGEPHPKADNKNLFEWNRRNIENYLLVPTAWKRALCSLRGVKETDLFVQEEIKIIDNYFKGENLTLPEGQTWEDVSANVFSVVDGKKILYDGRMSLFHQLRRKGIELKKDNVAESMLPEEIHDDIKRFFKNLSSVIKKEENIT